MIHAQTFIVVCRLQDEGEGSELGDAHVKVDKLHEPTDCKFILEVRMYKVIHKTIPLFSVSISNQQIVP